MDSPSANCRIAAGRRYSASLAFPTQAQLGEGAVWDVGLARLLWVDILGNKVNLFDPLGGGNLSYDVGQNVGTVVVTRNGNFLLGLRKGFGVLVPETGEVYHLLAPEPTLPGNRLNDGKCDPAGRFWVGSMVEKGPAGDAALYRLDHELRVKRMLEGVSTSNGLAWVGKTFYYVDTPTRQIQAFDWDEQRGLITGQRVAYQFAPGLGSPDGMTVDAGGLLWVALWGGGAVVAVDPLRGEIVAEVAVPAKNVTSCAFGGEALERLYITTARVGLSGEQLQVWPAAGSLFVADVESKGLPGVRFSRELSPDSVLSFHGQ